MIYYLFTIADKGYETRYFYDTENETNYGVSLRPETPHNHITLHIIKNNTTDITHNIDISRKINSVKFDEKIIIYPVNYNQGFYDLIHKVTENVIMYEIVKKLDDDKL